MTISEAYIDFTEKLKTVYEDREAENISDWIFENVTGLKKWQRRENKKNELTENHFEKIENYLEKLMKHTPVQYVLNEAWFYKMKFFVNENVLIPRPETEELVEWIINDLKNTGADSEATNIVDIGTGSGCIPVALKKELPDSNISAIEVSEKALLVAKKNAAKLNASINFFQINFLNEDAWKPLQAYDTIVSNPPYIPFNEKEILAKNVTDFEPAIALFVENNDPFIFYKKIAEFSKAHLKPKGKIFVEVHEAYANEVKNIFENSGYKSEIKKDIYGKERMVKGIHN
jgi:release factor glutamine methyltransferase